jgi:hypothetical protein
MSLVNSKQTVIMLCAIDVRISFLSYGKKMGCLLGPGLASIDLNHARDIERIDLGKRICGNENYARVCVDFLLGISKLDGLED